jgi:hypothetical protein
MKNQEIKDAIKNYLQARSAIIAIGKKYPHEMGGNDNIIGRIGEYIGLQFLKSIGQNPIKVQYSSNPGYDFIDEALQTQVKVITSENESGKNVRLKKPWNQFVLIELNNDYIPKRIGVLTEEQHQKAILENPNWSQTPVVKLSMLSKNGLIGKYGKIFHQDEISI